MAEKKYQVTFAKPYVFEGKEYTGVDLSGLDSMTSNDLFEASQLMSTSAYISPRPEADPKFCCIMAARASHLPNAFFDSLPMKEAVKIRNEVQAFFQSED